MASERFQGQMNTRQSKQTAEKQMLYMKKKKKKKVYAPATNRLVISKQAGDIYVIFLKVFMFDGSDHHITTAGILT